MTLKRPAPQLIKVIVVVVCALLHVDGLHGFAPSSAEHSIGDNFNVPCKYMDSISVAELNNYARLVGDANWTTSANTTDAPSGYYDYAIDYGTIRRPVARHRRVCVCHRRPCVRLRCARGMTFDEDTGICSADQRVGESTVALLTSTGVDRQTVDLFEHFGYTVGKACDEMTPLVPDEIPSDAWDMDAMGNVVVGPTIYTQHQYSMYMRWNENSSQVDIVILVCYTGFNNLNRFDYLPYGMLLSVPFLVLTFLVYAILPELRNLNGKSLMCYLACLANGYSLLSFLQLKPGRDNWWCRPFGYMMYFWFIAAFFWLNVISFELWWTFRDFKGRKLNGTRKFLLYSGYAWGLPLTATLLWFMLDSVSWAPSFIQPGIGLTAECFLKPNRWIKFFYFNLPTLLIFVANGIFFTLTTIKIRHVQLEMVRITSKDESRRHKSQFDQEKDKFGMFLRLFIVMGITWLMESISFLFDPAGWVFIVTDVLNCCQGLVIFLLFVMKPKVKKLLLKRYQVWRGIPAEQTTTYSNKTTTSSLAGTQSINSTRQKCGQDNTKQQPQESK